MSCFGQQLKNLRKQKGLRQKDLASRFDVAQSTIANYEQGTRFPDELMLRQLADAFEVTQFDRLLGRCSDDDDSGGYNGGNGSNGKKSHLTVTKQLKASPMVGTLIDLILQSRIREAEELVDRHIGENNDIETVYGELLQPALYEIGRLWKPVKSMSVRSIISAGSFRISFPV